MKKITLIFCALTSMLGHCQSTNLPSLEITEIFSGQAGADLTADWFEIKNTGDTAYMAATDGALYYDDESADPNTADLIEGISSIPAGGYAIVLITGAGADVATFTSVWGAVIDLTGVSIGTTDGAGLGGGGDVVHLWIGDPQLSTPFEAALYPDTDANDGQTFDVSLMAFSEVGNANGAVQTNAVAGDGTVANIGSPGDGAPIIQTEISFAGAFTSVNEEAGTVDVVVQISDAPLQAVSVDVTLVPGGSAVQGTDFTFATSQTLTFPAGSNAPQTITIPILDNPAAGVDTYFMLGLANETNADLGEDTIFAVYILDGDTVAPSQDTSVLNMNYLASYSVSESGTAEIVAFDPIFQTLFVVNDDTINILDFNDPENISEIDQADISVLGASAQSVAVFGDLIAIAVSNNDETERGFVVFSDTQANQEPVVVQVGVLPDMLTFTPDGTKVLVANEGEPTSDYSIDPEGSVSIIDVSGGLASINQSNVTEVSFTSLNGTEAALNAQGIRIYGPGATAAQDLEPEYIAVSQDNAKAYVACQENNAYIVIDIETASIDAIFSFGLKDHNLPQNTLDVNDETDFIFNANWPIKGMYMPDAISFYSVNGVAYIVTANEGDAREYDAIEEEVKIDDDEYVLDPTVFPNAALLALDGNLPKINITNASGDLDGDGDFDEIHVFGGRSFSIFEANTGTLVYDSGNDFELITAADPEYGPIFNASNSNNEPKNRSDNKGPEPEGVIVEQIGDAFYAFILLERIGGVMVYDVTDPTAPQFLQYVNNRSAIPNGDEAGDLGPEGLVFVSAENSPTETAMLVVANEVSGTLSVYSLDNIILNTETFQVAQATFRLFPNPAIGVVYFDTRDDYTVVDLMGREVIQQTQTKQLSIDSLQAGTYIVTNSAGVSQKLIVK